MSFTFVTCCFFYYLNRYVSLYLDKYKFIVYNFSAKEIFMVKLVQDTKTKKWTVVDNHDTLIIDYIFDDVSQVMGVEKGRCPIVERALVKKDGKWGVVNKQGEQIVQCKYDVIGDFSESYAQVERDGKVGLIDKNGVEFIPCVYDELVINNRSTPIQAKFDGSWCLVDWSGVAFTPVGIYDSIDEDFERDLVYDDFDTNGYFIVTRSGKYGVVNSMGVEVVGCQYVNKEDIYIALAYVEDDITKIAEKESKILDKIIAKYEKKIEHARKKGASESEINMIAQDRKREIRNAKVVCANKLQNIARKLDRTAPEYVEEVKASETLGA